MTLRTRPGSKGPRIWEDRDRRNFLMNVGFGLTVIAALLLLGIAFFVTWYSSHLASVATVNGQSINHDALTKQIAINTFRVDYQSRRTRTLLTAGHLRATDAQARLDAYTQVTQNAPGLSLEQLVDAQVMEQLALTQGVTVSDADVQAHLTDEFTTPESRHAWVIAVTPALATGQTIPTEIAKSDAGLKAASALKDLQAGKDWATVAAAVSDDPTKGQAGDLGFIDKDSSLDAPFVTALMAAPKDTPTAVVEGADGTFRIGRVTEIVAPVADPTFQSQMQSAGVSLADFEGVMRVEVLQKKLDDAVVATLLGPAPQRKVAQIWMAESSSESGPSAIKVRHILYSPKGDPDNASKVPDTDPAWAAAKAKADATYAKLQADPTLFDSIARTDSNESQAKTSGGKLSYFSTDDTLDQAFADAIFQPGLVPGQLLPPVKSAFGWHVIQVMHGPTDIEWANKLKAEADAGTSFAQLARDNSDLADAATGGDQGWIAKGVLSQQIEDAIFAAPIGKVSDPLQITGDGVYLWLVSAQETRTPDATQAAAIRSKGFASWYAAQKATFAITRAPGIAGAGTG